ncbi:hypothetical protein BD560DRAFT_490353 [Blakeslea trispora]|nr:hypothetical protein BD560DRAFT_490353 [Blakeslea trispora]
MTKNCGFTKRSRLDCYKFLRTESSKRKDNLKYNLPNGLPKRICDWKTLSRFRSILTEKTSKYSKLFWTPYSQLCVPVDVTKILAVFLNFSNLVAFNDQVLTVSTTVKSRFMHIQDFEIRFKHRAFGRKQGLPIIRHSKKGKLFWLNKKLAKHWAIPLAFVFGHFTNHKKHVFFND